MTGRLGWTIAIAIPVTVFVISVFVWFFILLAINDQHLVWIDETSQKLWAVPNHHNGPGLVIDDKRPISAVWSELSK